MTARPGASNCRIQVEGFSLHAAAPAQVHDRKRPEQLCRDITRSALSDERVRLKAARQVELKITPAGSTSSTRSNSSNSRARRRARRR